MKEKRYERKICVQRKSGIVRQLLGKLMTEERPFEMHMRRVSIGVQEVELYTDDQGYTYFEKLLNEQA